MYKYPQKVRAYSRSNLNSQDTGWLNHNSDLILSPLQDILSTVSFQMY